MIDTKVLYGITRIDEKEFEETHDSLKIDLKYYKTKSVLATPNKKKFGIEIIKEEVKGANKTKEKGKIYNITNNETIIENLLKIFIQNKVTPISINDIISDLRKNPELVYNFKG